MLQINKYLTHIVPEITLCVMPYYVTLCWIGVVCGCRSLTGAEINPKDIFAGEKQKVEISSLFKLKPKRMQHSQSQDLSEEEEGSVLAWCCWTGLWRAGEEAGHSPRNILSLQREQGIHIYHSVGSHAQALPLDINICMTCADMRDPIISHSNSS